MQLSFQKEISNEVIYYDVLSTKYKGLYNRVFKRALDAFFAFIFFICLLPLYLIIGIAIVVETGFPILYKPVRCGYHNKNFTIFKFRTMIQNADKIGGGTTGLNDGRITKVGYILRKVKLDETPQLVNIINGDMSFVGVRPELIKYSSQYIGDEKLILQVRPGITDYSSLKFISLDELVGSEQPEYVYENSILPIKNKLRIKYATEVSLYVDAKIFILTIVMLVKKIYRLLRDK